MDTQEHISTSELDTTLEDGEIMKSGAAVSIVGGSLVGPVTELLLRRAGFNNVTTYEAAPNDRVQRGGIIGIEDSAFPVLAQAGIPISEIDALGSSGVDVYDMTPDGIADKQESLKFNGINTTWDLFHDAVARRVDIQGGKRVVGLDSNGNKAVLSFKDGSQVNSDLVIFADGRGSVGRSLLDSGRPSDYQGYVVWRGMSTPPNPSPENFTRYCDLRNGTLLAVSSPILNGQSAGLCDWALYENMSEEEFTQLAGSNPRKKPFVFPHQITPELQAHLLNYAGERLPPALAEVIANTNQVSLVPISDMDPPRQAVWRKGKAGAVLLGDALMPVRPHTARGLNNGLEQAAELVSQLSGTPVGKAFRTWEEDATKNLPDLVTLGRQLGSKFGLGTPASPGATQIREDLLKLVS